MHDGYIHTSALPLSRACKGILDSLLNVLNTIHSYKIVKDYNFKIVKDYNFKIVKDYNFKIVKE